VNSRNKYNKTQYMLYNIMYFKVDNKQNVTKWHTTYLTSAFKII